jgi:hypothetical protein
MSNFKKVQVDFDKTSSVRRVIVPKGSNVKAIFLDGSGEAMTGLKRKRVKNAPEGLIVEPQTPEAADGDDTPVCYLIDNQLVCW